MDKLKIGIILDPNLDPIQGGSFSYQESLVRGIDDYSFSEDLDISFILFYNRKKPIHIYKKPVIYIHSLLFSRKAPILNTDNLIKGNIFIWYLKNALWIRSFLNLIKKWLWLDIENQINRKGIEIVFPLVPQTIPLNIPFILNHWDIGHLSTYAFPEMVSGLIFKERERYYQEHFKKAFLILCESESGIRELQKFYPVFNKRIELLPIFPSSLVQNTRDGNLNIENLGEWGLRKEKYFFYPAQFWSHKNHFNLICAFEAVYRDFPDIKLVFSGFDMGNLLYIRDVIEKRNLGKAILIVGFVELDILSILYENALALVMPSFLGPTNMPIMEAALLGCPVICSDLEGHREIMGETAIYVNPDDFQSIEHAMKGVLNSNFNRTVFAMKARENLLHSKFNLRNTLEILDRIFRKMYPIRKTWGKQV